MARVQVRRYSSIIMSKYNIQQYTWFYDIYTYDTVFVKADESKPAGIGVVCPPLRPLPAFTIYVVYLDDNGFGRGKIEHEEVHMRYCRLFDEKMNHLNMDERVSLQETVRYQSTMRYFRAYESISIDKKVICMKQAVQYCMKYCNNTTGTKADLLLGHEMDVLPKTKDKVKSRSRYFAAENSSNSTTSVCKKENMKSSSVTPRVAQKRSSETVEKKRTKRCRKSEVNEKKRILKRKILQTMKKIYNL